MLLVQHLMNNMAKYCENGHLLSNQMSRLIFHRYSVFCSTLSGAESGKVCTPQRTNQWTDTLELLNLVAFPSSTPTWLQQKQNPPFFWGAQNLVQFCHSSFHLVAFCILCFLPLRSPVHLSFNRCDASQKNPSCCCTYYTKNRDTQKNATEI